MKKALVYLSVCLVFTFSLSTVQAQVGIFDNTATWNAAAFPNTPQAGTAKVTNGKYSVTGNGRDVWDNGDEGFFAFTSLQGDYEIRAKVKWIDGGLNNDWSKAGIMIRDNGASPESAHYWIELRSGPDANGVALGDRTDAQWRDVAGQSSGNAEIKQANGSAVTSPDGVWYSVSRNGNVFTSRYSLDGKTWTVANTHTVNFTDNEAAYGLVVTSHTEDTEIVTAEFTSVSISAAVSVNTNLITLQEGVGGYAGTTDAHIISWDGNQNQLVRKPDGTNGGNGGTTATTGGNPQNTGGHNFIEEGDFGGGSNDSKATLIKFDTSSIAAADARRLARAQIGLYHAFERSTGGSNPAAGTVSPHVVNVQPILKPWLEGNSSAAGGVDGDDTADNSGAVTWNSTGTVLWEAIGAEGPSDVGPVISSTFFDTIPGQWIWLDVTSAARNWIANPASNNGVKISQETDNVPENPPTVYPKGAYNFASSEHADASLRPQLALEFIDASSVGDEWSVYE